VRRRHDGDGTVCVVAILRDELPFVDEWLAYHRLLGVDHFVLYDDDAELPLADYVAPHAAYTTVVDWYGQGASLPGRNRQTKAYTHAVRGIAGRFDWVAFIDGDEFIVLRQDPDVHTFLSRFSDAGAVSLHWHSFGHSGYYDDPPGLVTASLTRRMREPGRMAKSITQVSAIRDIPSAHYCNLQAGFRRVDPNGRPFADALYHGKTEVAHVNHYMARSFQRWLRKADRGDVAYTPNELPPQDRWKADRDQCLRRFVEIVAKTHNEHVDESMLVFQGSIMDYLARIGATRRSPS
jgi:hypothetical protein